MTIFNQKSCFVWIWLPNAIQPVVCGKVEVSDDQKNFYYGRSYLKNKKAIALDHNTPLEAGIRYAQDGTVHNVIHDSLPDAWGQRVLLHRHKKPILSLLDMLLLSSSDRIGALHFQHSADQYLPQYECHVELGQLIEAAKIVEKGRSLPESLKLALMHGTSVGGARPKALICEGKKNYIAKFSSSTDFFPVVRVEFAAMLLAQKVGLNAASVKLVETQGKAVLLVERFDRMQIRKVWTRKFMVSALTLLGLNEYQARDASYPKLSDLILKFSSQPKEDALELFRRMAFNVLVGNTDDHAKNHAFFWDGMNYRLTPAYDICPYPRAGQEATQAMILGKEGNYSQLRNVLSRASHFQLTEPEARNEIDQLVEGIRKYWPETANKAKLTKIQQNQFLGTSLLNPYCFYGY